MSEHQGYCLLSLGEPCGNCHRCTPADPAAGTGLGLGDVERTELLDCWRSAGPGEVDPLVVLATFDRLVAARVAEAKAWHPVIEERDGVRHIRLYRNGALMFAGRDYSPDITERARADWVATDGGEGGPAT